MSTVTAIEAAIKDLSLQKAQKLAEWLQKYLGRDEAEEDQADAAEARRVLAEAEKEGFTPWEEVKARAKRKVGRSAPAPKITTAGEIVFGVSPTKHAKKGKGPVPTAPNSRN